MKRAVFLLFILLSTTTWASKYYVNDGSTSGDVFCTAVGATTNNGTSAATPKLTLASVLSSYSSSFAAGDTIFVDAGAYSDNNLNCPKNGVVIQGAGMNNTIFTCSGSDNYFMVVSNNNTVIGNLQLYGYNNQTVSGVQALAVSANVTGVQFNNLQVANAATSSTSGGYPIQIASGASVILNGGGVTCNSWNAGGGIQVVGSSSTVVIKNYQFLGNNQLYNNGTALNITNGKVSVYNSRFEINNIGGDLAGLCVYLAAGTLNVYDSYFNGNQTNILNSNVGGAISIAGGSAYITRSVFSNNVPSSGTSGIYGAGIGITNGTVKIDSCSFSGNVGARSNDIYVKGGTVTANNCTFGSSTSQIGIAGGNFTISNCGNPSKYGNGITVSNTTNPNYTPNPTLPAYLSTNCSLCLQPAITGGITGTATQCPSATNQIYSITKVNNATTYTWTVPSGWTITSGANTNSIKVTTSTVGKNGTITVTAKNTSGSCSLTSGTVSLNVTVVATPATPGTISGYATQCPALTMQKYKVSAVNYATTYNWTVPTGWAITGGAGSDSILVTAGSAGHNGNISVTASNSCGVSSASTFSVVVNPSKPATPGSITGTAVVCPNSSGLIYSIAAVANATTYNWTLPSGWRITAGAGTNTITVKDSTTAVGGNIAVTASNSCGVSSASTFSVVVNPSKPATPGSITGTAVVCPNSSGLIYSIAAVANATTYNWTLPSGWRITAGAGTNTITVKDSTTAVGGNIAVTAGNSCGVSSSTAFAVSMGIGAPTAIGTITGISLEYSNKSGQIYSTSAVANATSYLWTVPSGWVINAGQGTTQITVSTGTAGQNGLISVAASNSCGAGPSSNYSVAVNGTCTNPGYWWGGYSSNWWDYRNWQCLTVPDSTVDVRILNTAAHMPIVTNSVYCHNLVIEDTSAWLKLGSSASKLNIYGNLTVLNQFYQSLNDSVGSIIFKGNDLQTIDIGADGSENAFYQLVINDAQGVKVLNHPLFIDSALTLTKGVLYTNNDGLLIFDIAAICVNGSTSSYVNGPVSKLGNTQFNFPLGANGHYKPLYMTAPMDSGAVFTAQYFNSAQAFGQKKDSSLTQINEGEFWLFDRNEDSASVSVRLGIDSVSGILGGNDSLYTIIAYDAANNIWRNQGSSNLTNNNGIKSLQSSANLTVFGAITTGTKSYNSPGSSAINAVNMQGDTASGALIGNVVWYKYIADSIHELVVVNTTNFFKNQGRSVDYVALYSGPSNNLTLLNLASRNNPTDTVLVLNQNNLIHDGHTVYHLAIGAFPLPSIGTTVPTPEAFGKLIPAVYGTQKYGWYGKNSPYVGNRFPNFFIKRYPITVIYPSLSCQNCIGSFRPDSSKSYLVSAWVKEAGATPMTTSYTKPLVVVKYSNTDSVVFYPSGLIIDGWQRIEGKFKIPNFTANLQIALESTSGKVYFDDVRVFPFDGTMKSYVYDPLTLRLMAELDERNYATLYEYDEEGKLIRVKKETERGIMTIKESKNSSVKR